MGAWREILKFTEEQALSGRVRYHVVGRHVEHFHNAGQLFDLVLSGEDGVAGVQLGQDAPCRVCI